MLGSGIPMWHHSESNRDNWDFNPVHYRLCHGALSYKYNILVGTVSN